MPCFIVRDHNGQQLAPCRRSAAKLLMRVRRGESRRISLAKLPELLPFNFADDGSPIGCDLQRPRASFAFAWVRTV